MPDISGETLGLPIIGRPIRQVKAPMAFNAYFKERDIDAVCTPLELSDDAADAFIAAMRGTTNVAGFIATIPHKQRAAAACDRLSDRARFLGATNLIRRDSDGTLVGDMTDGLGCVAAMRGHGVDPAGKSAFVIGVGGAGSAIAHALLEAKVARLQIDDLDAGRTAELRDRLKAAFPSADIALGAPDMATVDIAVNASPVGMNGDPNLPVPLGDLPSTALVADVVTMPAETPWLKAAAARGCVTQTGLDMVRGQFDLMARHFGFPVD